MRSATLLVAMLQETGHLNPTFKLMRNLRARGHQVRYLATDEVAKNVAGQGFATLPLSKDFDEPRKDARGLVERFAQRRAITKRFRDAAAWLRERDAGAFGETPQLMLVDVTQTHLALWARARGIPLVLLSTSLPQTRDAGIPLLRSGRPFAEDTRARLLNELTWQLFLTKRRAFAEAASLVGARPPYHLVRRLSAGFGVHAHELDSATVYMPQLRNVPELVLCPRELDFPRPAQAHRYFVESVDLTRQEKAPDFPLPPEGKPLVYCSFGSQDYRAAEVLAFLQRVVQAFARRPDLNLVVSTGADRAPEQLAPWPANVVVRKSVPQLALLARARLMITHGGLGSVKECVAHGVPMLVFPLAVDQPGNAARVLHHGLGLVGDVVTTGGDALLQMVDRVLGDPSFAVSAAKLRSPLLALEETAPGAQIVERFLAQPEPSAALRTAPRP